MTQPEGEALKPVPPIPSEPVSGGLSALKAAGLALVFGLLASAGLAVFANVGETFRAMERFDERWLLAAVAAALLSNVPKALRWHRYLRRVTRPGERMPTPPESGAIYLSGVTMMLTPGMVGEWLKSYQVQALGGAPPARTAPIVIAERVTNILGLVLLSGTGLVAYRTAFWAVAASAVLAGGLVVVITSPVAARHATAVVGRIPVVRRFVPHVDEFAAASVELMRWRSVAAMSLLAWASWILEAGAYVAVLRGMGIEITWTTMNEAGFVWAVTTLAGGLFLTPGGLGVQEGGLAGLGATLVAGLDLGPAAAAALLTRLATLWIPAALGLASMAWLARRPAPVVVSE